MSYPSLERYLHCQQGCRNAVAVELGVGRNGVRPGLGIGGQRLSIGSGVLAANP